MEAMRADLLIESGIQHAVSLIQQDISNGGLNCDSPETDPQLFAADSNSKWYYVKDNEGKIIGRYKLEISDECGKLNVNILQSLAEHSISSDKKSSISARNNPLLSLLSPKAIRALRKYQYGPNKVPGMRNVDDNKNNITLENDGLDNNFNGVIDEVDEGVDEPAEYDTRFPAGDDRTIDTIAEIPAILSRMNPGSSRLPASSLARFLTTYSVSHSRGEGSAEKQICINGANVRELAKAIRSIKKKKTIQRNSKAISTLVCNIMDFRDENHSLSTHAGSYGVEAVCFNEIMANDGSHLIQPYGRNWMPSGNGNDLDEKYSGVIGLTLDPYNKDTSSEPVAEYPFRPTLVRRVGNNVKVIYDGPVIKKSKDTWLDYKELFNMLRKRGKTQGDNILYPGNFWKNAHMIFRTEKGQKDIEKEYKKKISYFPEVISSDARTVTVEGRWGNNNEYSTYDTLMEISSNISKRVGFWLDNHWERTWGLFSVMPSCTEWAISEIRPRTYFRAYIGNNSFIPAAFKGNSSTLDCDGNPSMYSETEEKMLKWDYNEGKPIQSDAQGVIDLIVTSSKSCNRQKWENAKIDHNSLSARNTTKSVITHNIFVRPDIVELINVSDKSVSIAGWRVMVNTGSVAKELCRIDSAPHYEPASGGYLNDENPIIPPNGYAYLTSDRKIFDLEYGSSKSEAWGDSAKEQYSCYELPQETWGVWYKIKGFKPASRNLWGSGGGSPRNNIILDGGDFTKGELAGEMVEFRSDRNSFKGNDLNGFRRMVTGNTREAIEILYGQGNAEDSDIRVGDYAVILGIPRIGGFLSLTLRNEYNQITSRTLEYGKTDYKDFDVSTERPDPAVFDVWHKTSRTTFGGNFLEARSRDLTKIKNSTVLNRSLDSLEDLLEVSSGDVNVTYKSNESDASAFLKTVGPVLTMDMVRLDAEADDAWKGSTGSWYSTSGSVAKSSKSGLSVVGAKWEPGIWKDNTLTLLTGKLRGEQFKIADNAGSTVNVKGRSTQKRAQLSARRGDKCNVGPPYRTPMYYTRRENSEGNWEWQNTGLDPEVSYDLYLFGLNDSIATTEFLEENHNAQLKINVWNFEKQDWDVPPKKRYKYDKNDSVYFGRLNRENIGNKGAIKLSVTAHNLADAECSGTAWLDYILLTPVERQGKINVNTASERVIATLPGVNNKLARNIVKGISKDGKPIRPYLNAYNLLDIKGMNPELMCRIANYITVRTDTYRVNVTAEIFKNQPESKEILPGNIAARDSSTFVLERIPKSKDKWKIVQRETISM